MFRTWSSIESKVYQFKPVFEKHNFKRVVIFRNGGTWALAHKTALVRLLNETGGELVADFEGVQVDGNDFATQIVQAKELAPDAVFFAVNNGDAVSVMKKFRELDFSPVVFSTDGGMEDAIRRGQIPSADVREAYLIDSLSDDADFVQKFEKKHGKQPGITADAAYLAMKLVADAYRSGATDGESVRAYLENSGAFDSYGDIKTKDGVYSVINGEREPV